MHSSLMRILTPGQLDEATRAAINQKCQEWTQQLHGTKLNVPEAWCALDNCLIFLLPAECVCRAGLEVLVKPSE